MSDNVFYVYLHRRNDTNEVFYVGKGKLKRATDKRSRNIWWHNIVSKHGYEVEYVEKGLSNQCALDLEIELIRFYKECGHKLCNLTSGGGGIEGYKHSAEVRAKISASKKMKPVTQVWRDAASFAHKGRIATPEHRAAISKALTGVQRTQAQKDSIKIPIECSNGMKFKSATDAAEWPVKEGITKTASGRTAITACCRGRSKVAYKFKWRYAQTGKM